MCRLRSLIALSALGCLSLAGCSSDGPSGPARVVILADTHVIGPQYTTAVENSAADNESILLTPARLRAARDRIHAMVPLPDAVVILGDVVHAAHHAHDIAWYRENRSAFTVTKEILDTFEMPVHVLMGNHDYEVNCDGGESYDRALSEALFREFFGAEPYYEVTYGGVRLYLLNGQQGATWDVNSPACDTGRASFGATQLDWLDRGLSDGRPSIVMSHYMGVLWASGETPDVPERADLNNVLAAHDNVAMYLAGHTHRWIDLSALYGHEHYVIGPGRYDEDNFWVLELGGEGGPIEILDRDKAIWWSSCARTYSYDPGPMSIDDAVETGTCVMDFDGF